MEYEDESEGKKILQHGASEKPQKQKSSQVIKEFQNFDQIIAAVY